MLSGGSGKFGHFLDFCNSDSRTRVSVELSITDLLSSLGVVLEAEAGWEGKLLNSDASRQPEDSSEELLDFLLYSGHTSGVDSFDPFCELLTWLICKSCKTQAKLIYPLLTLQLLTLI